MNFKKTLVGAALSLSLVPFAAQAEHEYSPVNQQYQQAYQAPGYQTSQQAEPCPAEPPRGFKRHQGRYEVRSVQRWVEGRYQQVWVPEQCSMRERQRGWVRQTGYVCVPAHYDRRWVPAHYETAQQWVWVPSGAYGHRHFGRRWSR